MTATKAQLEARIDELVRGQDVLRRDVSDLAEVVVTLIATGTSIPTEAIAAIERYQRRRR